MPRRTLFTALTSAAAILILATGCTDQSPTGARLDPTTALSPIGRQIAPARASQNYGAATYSKTITAQGGTLSFGIGEISFPAGAVSQPTRISATVDGTTMSVRFEPHGIEFPSGASPVLSFDASKANIDLNQVGVFYVDDSFRILEVETSFGDIGGGTVNSALGHFSQYVLATD